MLLSVRHPEGTPSLTVMLVAALAIVGSFPTSITKIMLSSASSSLYVLSTLSSKGLPEGYLHLVARTITLIIVLYASPAWWGYASSKHRYKFEANKANEKKLMKHCFALSVQTQTIFSVFCSHAQNSISIIQDPGSITSPCHQRTIGTLYPAVFIETYTEHLTYFHPYITIHQFNLS